LAAELCPDPLGELQRFPRLPKRNGGILLRVERAWEGGERPTSKGDENEGRKEGTEREGKGIHRKVSVSRINTGYAVTCTSTAWHEYNLLVVHLDFLPSYSPLNCRSTQPTGRVTRLSLQVLPTLLSFR